MTIALGRLGRVKKNGTEIGKVTTPTLNSSAGTIDLTSLGDDWMKYATGMNQYTLDFTMFMVSDDAGQNALYTAWQNKTGLNDIELWVDATTYFACDTVTDSEAEMLVTTYNVSYDNNSAVAVKVTLTGSGPLTKETSV